MFEQILIGIVVENSIEISERIFKEISKVIHKGIYKDILKGNTDWKNSKFPTRFVEDFF